MSYHSQSLIAADGNILSRVTACAAAEGVASPEQFATTNRWVLSAQPGWSAAYADALKNGVELPGVDSAVISDEMILTAVQSLREPSE